MPKPVIENWGRTAYKEALERQLLTLQERREGARPDTLAFTEHNPVFTVGKRRDAAQHLIADSSFLSANGIEVVETNRGGDITYHGPGQITGYLFLDLSVTRDLHLLLRQVEDMIIAVVASYGLTCGRRDGMTGVWLEERKIAAIGMAARHWISFHGFALNVSTNLSHFDGIVPCGITNGTVTSLEKELGQSVAIEEVMDRISTEFRNRFTINS
tara:strand:+ start:50832 stop:51473 length:642 start_codon:yes stop_codon:yes gene_type:complete